MRILYNRASCDKNGKPYPGSKPIVWWDEQAKRWTGHDVPDVPVLMRDHLAGCGEELGGLGADHRQIFVFRGRGFLATASCMHLALGNHARRREERISSARSEPTSTIMLEGLAEQEVAHQHACLVAPDQAGGRPAAPQLAFVHHVVMQQGGGVHELHRGRQPVMPVAGIAGDTRHRQRQHGPQPLATRGDQVIGDFRNHGRLPIRCGTGW